MSDDHLARLNVDPDDPTSPHYSPRNGEPTQPVPTDLGIDPFGEPSAAEWWARQHSEPLTGNPWVIIGSTVGMSVIILWGSGDHRMVFSILTVGAPFALLLFVCLKRTRRQR